MTKTRNDVVQLALQKLKVADLIDSMEAEHLSLGLTALDAILAEGRIKYWVWWTIANDDLIPDEALYPLSDIVAGMIAPIFNATENFSDKVNNAKGDMLLLAPLTFIKDPLSSVALS